MLISDNIHPKNCIYYTGGIVLSILQNYGDLPIDDLYAKVKQQNGMTFPVLLLSLDWLYLINAAIINEKGEVKLCS